MVIDCFSLVVYNWYLVKQSTQLHYFSTLYYLKFVEKVAGNCFNYPSTIKHLLTKSNFKCARVINRVKINAEMGQNSPQ